MIIKSKVINTTIDNIEYLSKDVVEITFKINGERLNFKPGQYIDIEISKEPLVIRAYSVLRYDDIENKLSVGIKRVPNGEGTSIIFNKFKIGMSIDISEPKGESLVVDKNKSEIILVATGIGITPIFCITQDLIKSKYKGNATLIYGVKQEKELFYFNELKSLVKQSGLNINIVPIISNQDDYEGHKGYVTDVIKNINLQKKSIYLCGSKIVESSLRELLIQKGFNLKNFFSESA